LEPPVTRGTLSELDVSKILNNPKLRHDINFDPELHFRPNLDGEKGRRKQERASQFWAALQEQLALFVTDRAEFYDKYGHEDDWCLPSLLKAVKEIIQTLVPSRDRDALDKGLDVALLMQQFNRGSVDLEKLAGWLSNVLKSHCAPMRDEWVDEMHNQLCSGNRNGDMAELVKGMRSLLSVLEAMKLDVANHQIRCLRPVLIEDTVHFEHRFFYKKIQLRKVDITTAREWYRDANRAFAGTLPAGSSQTFGDMGVFFEALSRLMLPSTSEKTVPNTFLFDEERIIKLRADMLDAINLELCMKLYEDLDRRYPRYTNVSYFHNDPSHTLGSDDGATLNSTSLNIALNFNFTTPPLAGSRPSSLVFSSAGSSNSSARSSWCIPSQATPDTAESKRRERELYSSLVALLHTSPPAQKQTARWQAMAPSLALQLFRFTNAPAEALPEFEQLVAAQLGDVSLDRSQEVEAHFHRKLMADLAKRVKEFKGLSGVALFSVATGGRITGPGRTWDGGREREREREVLEASAREAREEGGMDDMATRLAHLGVLHWRVWSQLAYNTGDNGGDFEYE
jgi:hypothetical protein